jgi:four helix bundle protein
MRDHKKLIAFEMADNLVLAVYSITRYFPKYEIYGLTSQLRRASVSVVSNIVEDCARSTQIEYHRFLEMAYGSLREADYQFNLSVRLGYTKGNEDNSSDIRTKFIETQKVLASLLKSME